MDKELKEDLEAAATVLRPDTPRLADRVLTAMRLIEYLQAEVERLSQNDGK